MYRYKKNRFGEYEIQKEVNYKTPLGLIVTRWEYVRTICGIYNAQDLVHNLNMQGDNT